MSFRNPQFQDIDNQQLSRINTLCDRFEDLLQEQKCPKIEDFLPELPAENRELLLAELLAIEVEFKNSEQTPPNEREYQERFSEYPDVVTSAFDSSKVATETPHTDLVTESIGDFHIIREIGRGGMGVVYEAQQKSLDRRVALKVLSRNVLTDGNHRERFEREARSAGRLHHSNIVPIFGVGNEPGIDYLAMQLIQGRSLDTVIAELKETHSTITHSASGDHRSALLSVLRKQSNSSGTTDAEDSAPVSQSTGDTRVATETTLLGARDSQLLKLSHSIGPNLRSTDGKFFWREIAELMRQAADALQYAHDQGVLHRDIKPGNLLLDNQCRIWITDFGLAKVENSHDLTQTGTLLGTVRYMAPEAFRGTTDRKADIYALGLTLYELAAFQPGIEADDQNQAIRKVMNESPPALQTINRAIPRDLQTIVQKAIQRDPAMRYATAADFAEDLRRFCHDEPILARRTSAIELAWRWACRHKLVAALSTALAVVLLTATTVLSVYANRVTGLNSELKTNAVQLTTAKNSADSRAAENAALAEQAQSSLVGMKIASAFGHVKDGKIQKAIVEMQAAWDSDTYESRADRSHQMRIGSLLDNYPEVVGLAMSSGKQAPPQYQAWNDLLMLSGDGVAEFWKPSTAEVLSRIQHDSETDAQMSADGKLLITRRNNDCLIWDIGTGKVLQTLKHETPVARARFSPDGSFIATACGDKTIRFWMTKDGSLSETTTDCDDNAPTYLDFVDNERMLASDAKDHVRLWSTRTGEALTPSLIHRPFLPHPPSFTIADERIATVDGKSWFLWDLNDGSSIAKFKINRDLESVHFCEHGGDVLVNAPESSYTWHYDFIGETLQQPVVNTLMSPRQSHRVAMEAGGDLAATTSSGGTTLVWDLRTQKVITELANVESLEFIDYRRLMVTGSNTTRIVSLRHRHRPKVTEKVADKFRNSRTWQEGESWTIDDVPGGSQFHYADRTGRLFARDGSVLRELKSPTGRFSARFSDDGTHLFSQDNRVYSVWDAATGRQIGDSFRKPDGGSLNPGADGIRIVVTFPGGYAAVWDMESGRYLLDGRPEASRDAQAPYCKWLSNIRHYAVAPNGKYIVIAEVGWLYRVVDIDTAELKFEIDRHQGVTAPIQFTSDSSRFITANSDTTARIWDAETGVQVGPYLPHPTYARAAAISDDGRYAMTCDEDDDIRTWDVSTGEQLGLSIYDPKFDRTSISFSDDLDRLSAIPTNGTRLQHRLARVRLDCETSRRLVELVTNLYDSGFGRSETLTDPLMENREQYIAAWQLWRKTLGSSDDLETVPTDDLVPRLTNELNKHSVYGVWTSDGETLTSDELRFSRIELPVEPIGSYEISMDFTRRSGNDHIGIQLPFCDGRSVLVVDSYPPEGLVSLEGIDGRARHSSGQTLGVMAPVDQERHLAVTVVQNGTRVDVRATLDDAEIYHWSGASRRLILGSGLDAPHHRRPTIQTHQSSFQIRNVRVTNVP